MNKTVTIPQRNYDPKTYSGAIIFSDFSTCRNEGEFKRRSYNADLIASSRRYDIQCKKNYDAREKNMHKIKEESR